MLYYLEVNAICIIILSFFLHHLRQQSGQRSTDQNLLKALIVSAIVFSASDLVAGVFRGQLFPGAWILLEVSNLLYFEALLFVSLLWFLYVHVRLTKVRSYRELRLWPHLLPVLAFTLVAVANPFTHFLFRINEQNLYERGPGIYLHWLCVWPYFLVATFRVVKLYLREKHQLQRQAIAPMLWFSVAPLIASILQMLFYGVTTTQVGITLSIVQICLALQNAQILTDALTGVNNRRGFENHLADSMQCADADAFLVMIDVDHFKHINDRCGHLTGDLVLQNVATALKDACRTLSTHAFLCRFGGDEFVIFGQKCPPRELDLLKIAIRKELKPYSDALDLPEPLTVSFGTAIGRCSSDADFRALLEKADLEMYADKQSHRSFDGQKV